MDCKYGFPGLHGIFYGGAHTDTEEGLERLKRLGGNVCFCPRYTVTIDPPKDTEKYIADDKVVQCNIKRFTWHNPCVDYTDLYMYMDCAYCVNISGQPSAFLNVMPIAESM